MEYVNEELERRFATQEAAEEHADALIAEDDGNWQVAYCNAGFSGEGYWIVVDEGDDE